MDDTSAKDGLLCPFNSRHTADLDTPASAAKRLSPLKAYRLVCAISAKMRLCTCEVLILGMEPGRAGMTMEADNGEVTDKMGKGAVAEETSMAWD